MTVACKTRKRYGAHVAQTENAYAHRLGQDLSPLGCMRQRSMGVVRVSPRTGGKTTLDDSIQPLHRPTPVVGREHSGTPGRREARPLLAVIQDAQHGKCMLLWSSGDQEMLAVYCIDACRRRAARHYRYA